MQVTNLFSDFDELQKIYGDSNLDAIYGCGEIHNPDICFVFMNPTSRNVAASKKWKGLKAPWIWTKNVWRMFYQLGFINGSYFEEINQKKSEEWDDDFAKKVYQSVTKKSLYITNLSKATQIDAKPLKDGIFRAYLRLFQEEISRIQPKLIVTFGNQVSSVFLWKNIKVSDYRKRSELITIEGRQYQVFPIYYPVGQWMRNIVKAKEDIDWIYKNVIPVT